jgi:hypothetical protein
LQKTYIHTCSGFFCNGDGTWKLKENKALYNNTSEYTLFKAYKNDFFLKASIIIYGID